MAQRFTNDEYNMADNMAVKIDGEKPDYVALQMENMKFNIHHDHEDDVLLISQRYDEIVMSSNGISEPKPRQLTITIQKHELADFLLELMVNSQCLAEHEKDEENE